MMQDELDRKPAPGDFERTIAACSQRMWQAYQNKDAVAHSAMLTDDYTSIHPNGTMHGRATAQQIAAEAIAGFKFSQRKVWRLADHAALSTYFADVKLPAGAQPPQIRFAASEVWLKQRDEWKCTFYQGTAVHQQ